MAVPPAMRAAAGKRCPGTAPPGLRRLLALTLATCAAMLIGGSTPDGAARGLASHHPLRPSAGTTARAGTSVVCVLAPGATKLPPNAVRGLAHHLRQYPAPSLATAAQRRAARDLLATIRVAASRWQDPRQAARAGFDTREAKRRAGDTTVHYLHAEHRRFSHDGRYLDPQRPESLIYANAPGRPLQLVGVMFSMPRGLHGPTPGGAIARWHSHLVCVAGDKRGLKPSPDGSCPRGSKRRQGSEMMHVWLTRDLRSAYAIHAPEPELCVAGLLSPARCLHTRGGQGM